jgi:hypothetical protein
MPVEMIGWIHPGPAREIRELTTVIEQLRKGIEVRLGFGGRIGWSG